MSEDVQKLLADMYASRGKPKLEGLVTVRAWVHDQDMRPGRALAIEATDIYRHYSQWCKARRYAPVQPNTMFREFKAMGFQKTRIWKDGRESRPYRTDRITADMFRDWLARHPTPEGSRLRVPNGPRSKAERLLDSVKALDGTANA